MVIADGTQRWQPDSGQVLLDFDVQELTIRNVERLPDKKRRVNIASAQAWFERGIQLEDISTEQAMDAYRKALELDPATGDAHVNLGVLHYQRGEFNEAEAHYREAIQCPASAVLAYFDLAVLHEDTNDPPAAIEAYQQVIEREPNFADAHHNLARLYEVEGRPTDAIRHYSAAHKLTKPSAKIP